MIAGKREADNLKHAPQSSYKNLPLHERSFHFIEMSSLLFLRPYQKKSITTKIAAEQSLVANRELIIRLEAKIQSTLARIWGGVQVPQVP